MKKQISKFSIHQTSKILAFVYFVIFAIICIPMGVIALFMANPANQPAFAFFIAPFFYLIITYIMTAIGLWFYNLLAKGIGGIEFYLTDVEPK